MSWFINNQIQHLSVGSPEKSSGDGWERNCCLHSANLQAFWLACVIWRPTFVTPCTCVIALAFLILQALERPRSSECFYGQYLLWTLNLCRLPSLLLAQKKKKKLYWAQKGAARLSSAQVSGSGVSPNSKQGYLLLQKHSGATGINMQWSCTEGRQAHVL